MTCAISCALIAVHTSLQSEIAVANVKLGKVAVAMVASCPLKSPL
jgi:hypothetical protein